MSEGKLESLVNSLRAARSPQDVADAVDAATPLTFAELKVAANLAASESVMAAALLRGLT